MRNWVEELVAECLQLQGFLVESGIPVTTAEVGGRQEVDVVGVKGRNNELEIRHVECGILAQGKKSAESLGKKFSSECQQNVEKHFRYVLGLGEGVPTSKNSSGSFHPNPASHFRNAMT